MTDGRKNSNEASDDDWAMSEPAPELKGKDLETEAAEEPAQNVSHLYDPLETDELEDWDLSSDNNPDAPVPAAPAAPQTPPAAAQTPPPTADLETPPNHVEIIKPEKAPPAQESWEMREGPALPASNWQMPDPEFRSSDGRPIQKTEDHAATAAAASQEVDEHLSEIYAPPETGDSFGDIAEEAEFSADGEEDFATEGLPDLPAPDTESPPPPAATVPAQKSRGRAILFLLIGFLLLSVLLLAVLGGAYFYYW